MKNVLEKLDLAQYALFVGGVFHGRFVKTDITGSFTLVFSGRDEVQYDHFKLEVKHTYRDEDSGSLRVFFSKDMSVVQNMQKLAETVVLAADPPLIEVERASQLGNFVHEMLVEDIETGEETNHTLFVYYDPKKNHALESNERTSLVHKLVKKRREELSSTEIETILVGHLIKKFSKLGDSELLREAQRGTTSDEDNKEQ